MSSATRHVLVAEDNSSLASVIRFNLERAGFQVTVACDGHVAWKAVQENHFDLIVTDLQMPRMTGCEFCSRLRSLTSYRDTPVIMMTAKGTGKEIPCENADLNISAIVLKPFHLREIVDAVKHYSATALSAVS